MKFTILQQDLLPALSAVSRSAGVHSTLPVLDNILLSCEGQKLKLAATNLEIGVIKYISIEDGADGAVTVPAKTLVEVVSDLGQKKIKFSTEGDILSLESSKFKASINGIPASEFPAIPLSAKTGIIFKKEVFLTSAQILFAAAVDEGRPVLTGILTDVSDSKLDFVATDGFRLAHRQISLPKNSEKFKSLIPKRTFEEVLRIISEEDVDQIKIASSENQNQAVFMLGETIVSSRLIEGQFPAWEKIIPQQITTRVILDKEQLLKAIKLAAVFAKNEANIVTLSTQKDFLNLQSAVKEIGSQENDIEASSEGEPIQIAFNTKFLFDAISNCPSQQVLIEFSGPLSASMIKPVGQEGLEYIVMPVRLS